jgi:hypothetical protein
METLVTKNGGSISSRGVHVLAGGAIIPIELGITFASDLLSDRRSPDGTKKQVFFGLSEDQTSIASPDQPAESG